MNGMAESGGTGPGTYVPERVIPTDVAGIVIWRGRRRTFVVKGERKRSRYYSVTHEPSGYGLMVGTNRSVKAATTLAEARRIVSCLGDVRWRGKPFDWTQPIDVVWANQRAYWACMTVAGWRMFGEYDKPTREWAERNDIDLSFGKQEAKSA